MIKRLEIRIILSLALVLAALIAMYGLVVGSRQSTAFVQSLSDNLQVLSRTIADNAAHFMVIDDYAGLDEHMLEAASLPEVLNVQVIDDKGRLVCNIERTSRHDPPQLVLRQEGFPPPEGSLATLKYEQDSLVSWTPITAGSRLGWVRIALSLYKADELKAATLRSTLMIGLISIIIGILLMIIVVRGPLQAIRELSRFAHDLQSRKGGQVSVRQGVYEIDLLADALNHSSQQLLAAEQQLLAEQERLTVTLQSIGDGVIAADTASHISLLNNVAERLTGIPQEAALGRPLADILSLEDDTAWNRIGQHLSAVLAENRPLELSEPLRLVSRTGAVRTVTIIGAPIINRGEQSGMVLVIRDITERAEMEREKKKLEEQLFQAQKMESIGQFAGGIAHDFNNILTAIFGYGELLRTKVEPGGKLAGYVEHLLSSAARAANLTRSLLAFSRKQSIELKPADLNSVVTGIQKMLSRLIGEDISFTVQTVPGPLMAMVDTGQIEQILMNLATNARDAMPDGGSLTIATAEVEVDDLYIQGISNGSPGPHALLSVSDNGAGMDHDTRMRIFEPFFTTKKVGKGTGLGLSIVYGIIQQHHGFITVYSEPGEGTCFRIHIPLLAGGSPLPAEAAAASAVAGTETILLAEDDSAVRGILNLTLQEAGYTVIEATSGKEAVDRYDENHARINLILMDVIMPVMNGKEAYDLITSRHPAARVIFMSGYTADVIHHKGIEENELMNFIHKPVSRIELLRKVREALDSPLPDP